MINDRQFHDAMNQVNEAFRQVHQRLEALEKFKEDQEKKPSEKTQISKTKETQK